MCVWAIQIQFKYKYIHIPHENWQPIIMETRRSYHLYVSWKSVVIILYYSSEWHTEQHLLLILQYVCYLLHAPIDII